MFVEGEPDGKLVHSTQYLGGQQPAAVDHPPLPMLDGPTGVEQAEDGHVVGLKSGHLSEEVYNRDRAGR